ncbi:MAG: alpha-1,2-fucosyltransferase [Verrucomicrobia bacterium]|nr:alpha-1,2-fucosyltransferase [Verrucomicrobiota bacterium]
MKPSVTSVIDGGVGNQMFQYAAARALSHRLGAELTLDVRRLNHRAHRAFGLADFKLAPSCRILAEGPPGKPPGRFGRLVRSALGVRDYFAEKTFAYDPAVLGLAAPVTLDGYFQSERYFREEAALIRADFEPKASLAEAIDWRAACFPPGPTASLHVRRGDYVEAKNQAYHGLATLAYYERALAILAERTAVMPTICVFTDDPGWVRANLPLPRGTRYVSEHTSAALEDLILMSRCTHHVTANSSFSWWGAWLNPRADKIVITPAQWFQPGAGLDTRDLRPTSWLAV